MPAAKRRHGPVPASKKTFAQMPGWAWGTATALIIGVIAAVIFLSGSGQAMVTAATSTPRPTPTVIASTAIASSTAATLLTSPEARSVLTPVGYTYTVANTFPHDPAAFTQGLIYLDDIFYEGTGLYTQSTLRQVDVNTGKVLKLKNLPDDQFGEGITVLGDRLFQLTWKNHVGYIYNKDTFEQLGTFTYPTEGWGITHDGKKLIMSDGTDTLYFWDPKTMTEIDRVRVYDATGPVVNLNELEYIDGEVWANIWQTNYIARIDPVTGQVRGWVDLSNVLPLEYRNGDKKVDVLNGIAYDAALGRLFVTGKLWPKIFEIKVQPLP
jgi:glutamine cyclotransferase